MEPCVNFREDINGLRAIAVLSVLLFHFFPSLLPGGFAGVDVFFVISGYLMTQIICDHSLAGNFRFTPFYAARAQRIFPALAFLCGVLLVFSATGDTIAHFNIDNQHAITKHIAASLSFTSNMVYWQEAGYFDAIATEKWLLHTWSLSLEWQFYLLYPLFVVLVLKVASWQWFRRIMLFSTIFALFISILITELNAGFAYYALPSRAWAMLLGGVAYLYPFPDRHGNATFIDAANTTAKFPMNIVRDTLFWLGMVCIAASFFWFDHNTAWPGAAAMLPILGCYVVIVARVNTPLLLRNTVMQTLGKWSYSVYLWHWPLLILAGYAGYRDGNSVFELSLFALASVCIGGLSYHVIEPQRKTGVILWAVVLAASAGVAWQTKQAIIAQKQAYFVQPNRAAYANNTGFCRAFSQEVCQQFGEANELQFVLWGDSHSINLRNYLAYAGYKFIAFSTAGCPPIVNVSRSDLTQSATLCQQQISRRVFERLSTVNAVNGVNKLLLIGRWNLYRYGWIKNGQRQADTHFLCRPSSCSSANNSPQHSTEVLETQLSAMLTALTRTEQPALAWEVMIMHGEPQLPVRGVDYSGRAHQQLLWQAHQHAQQPNTAWLAEVARQNSHLTLFNYSPALFENGQLMVKRNGRLLFKDDNHLLEFGWESLGPAFLQRINHWLQTRSITTKGKQP